MNLRYERKYRLTDHGVESVLGQVRIHPAGFRKQYPDRFVNNVYFDTPEFKTYHENVMGVPNRNKYRLRWYGQNLKEVIHPKFEIKTKHGELGYKVVSSWSGRFDLVWSQLTQEVDAREKVGLTLIPTLVNTYERTYFISADRRFRLTVDRSLHYYPVLKSQKLPLLPIREDIIIVEIKYDQRFEKEAEEIFYYIPYRQSKNSKYVNGVMLTGR